MESVEESAELKDGHYEIALPFRNRQHPVPNNRVQAEQRSMWLKRTLVKNPKLLDDYKVFVRYIVAKGYAKRVPVHQKESACEGKTWFIPHHGVYHPHKPGKISVVFDCSANYRGKSLNDLLLKGPDLTNSLLGVLTRFCQERVAEMVDIEAMFHQVTVPEYDRSFLRFLWWPDGDLSRALAEYVNCLNRHYFAQSKSTFVLLSHINSPDFFKIKNRQTVCRLFLVIKFTSYRPFAV